MRIRWLLPLLIALALALCAIDDAPPAERTRTRPAPGDGQPHDATREEVAATWQRGAFDPQTGTLMWFEDVYN